MVPAMRAVLRVMFEVPSVALGLLTCLVVKVVYGWGAGNREPVRPVAVEGAEAGLVGRIRLEFDQFVGESCFPARAENAVAGFRTGAPFRVLSTGSLARAYSKQ